MSGIPVKCPKCGEKKAWKEEINAFTSGIPVGGSVRIRLFVVRGLFARPFKKAIGCYDRTYRCHNCGFREKYQIDEL